MNDLKYQKFNTVVTIMKNKKSFLSLESDIDISSDRRPRLAMQRDIIQSRSKLLNRTDRILVHLVSEGNYKNVELAALLGISESSLTYHIGRLTKILGHEFNTFFRQPLASGADEWKVARMAYLNGRSLRAISRHTGLSMYRVRKITAKLKTHSESKEK
jgi:DNA-binding CsgD family transcriptional regulator